MPEQTWPEYLWQLNLDLGSLCGATNVASLVVYFLSIWHPTVLVYFMVHDSHAFFFVKQELDTEIIVAAARSSDATAVSANVVVDERQMNALFLDLVSFLIFWSYLENTM